MTGRFFTGRFFTVTMLVWGMALGCNSDTDPAPESSPEVPAAGEAVSTPDTPAEPDPAPEGQTETTDQQDSASDVTLQIKSWDETQELVKQAKGKIVVMDLWATYCAPCLIEFPHLVQLHKDHGDEVTCISVSLDYQGFEDEPVESYRDSVLEVLKGKGATMTNILCSTESDVIYDEKIELGSIPVVFVYDREGNLAATFPNPDDPAEFTYQEDVLPLVTKLLEQ